MLFSEMMKPRILCGLGSMWGSDLISERDLPTQMK